MNFEKVSSFDNPLKFTTHFLQLIRNLKNSLQINLDKEITIEEKSFAELFWIIYVQMDISSSKQYKQLTKGLGFIIVDESIR